MGNTTAIGVQGLLWVYIVSRRERLDWKSGRAEKNQGCVSHPSPLNAGNLRCPGGHLRKPQEAFPLCWHPIRCWPAVAVVQWKGRVESRGALLTHNSHSCLCQNFACKISQSLTLHPHIKNLTQVFLWADSNLGLVRERNSGKQFTG